MKHISIIKKLCLGCFLYLLIYSFIWIVINSFDMVYRQWTYWFSLLIIEALGIMTLILIVNYMYKFSNKIGVISKIFAIIIGVIFSLIVLIVAIFGVSSTTEKVVQKNGQKMIQARTVMFVNITVDYHAYKNLFVMGKYPLITEYP